MARYLSQKVSLLGTLESNLRELQGYDTLAYELIQNADDVRDDEGKSAASKIIFDIRDNALWVMNDGVFRQRDFERMLDVNSGDKRNERDTTGAFGIGFTAVYQITDCPEIRSSGQHWRFFPERDENNIEVDDNVVTQGTKFRLPYATNPESPLRMRLKQQTFDVSKLDEFQDTICKAVSFAALFLKQLTELEVRRAGKVVHHVTRLADKDANELLVDENGTVSTWMILQGDFEDESQRLRSQYPTIIEDKKHSRVSIAIPEHELKEYRLFAVLPTQETTKLTFHINADFYLLKDRKRIIFDDEYQTRWNRAAVRTVARIIVREFEKLKVFGYQRLWKLLNSIYQCSLSDPIDDVFKELWKPVLDAVRDSNIVYTTQNTWVRGVDARILYEWDALSIFEALGLDTIVDKELITYHPLLLIFGARRLTIEDVVVQLHTVGLDKQTHISQVIPALQTTAPWEILWAALENLRNKSSQSNQEAETEKLRGCAIILDDAGNLLLPRDVYAGDEDVQKIFWWLHWINDADSDSRKPIPERLVHRFVVANAITTLEARTDLPELWKANQFDLPRLFKFFDAHETGIYGYSTYKQRIRTLPIFPVAGELYPFSDGFYIAADFDDPLGIATLIDLNATGHAGRVLRGLGVKELSFINYVKYEVPKRFELEIDLTREQLRKLVHLLARQLGTLRDHEAELHPILAGLKLIECSNKTPAKPSQVYFSQDVQKILGEEVLIAVQPELKSIHDLYVWLGVAEQARTVDIIKRLQAVTTSINNFDSSFAIVEMGFSLLAERVAAGTKLSEGQLQTLMYSAWLPAKQHDTLLPRWVKPNELFSSFRDYLFNESDALFLGLSRPIQTKGADLIRLLKVQNDIPPRFVVQHLKRCFEKPLSVRNEVYEFFNDEPKGDWVEKLRDLPCLLVNKHYTSPDRVFWSEHPFGAYRVTLPSQWRRYSNLLDSLKVKSSPDFGDYCWVLSEIELKFVGKELEPAEKDIVYRCWRDFGQQLSDGKVERRSITEMLSESQCFPNRNDILSKPIDLLFEDRPEIAGKFDERIAANIIPIWEEQWKGLEAAGVRTLSEVLRARLVECDDPAVDQEYLARIQQRKFLFKRVVDTENKRDTGNWINGLFADFSIKQASRLVLQFALKGFENAISPAESVAALWSEEETTLFYCPQHKNIDIHIAREMAYALKLSGKTSLIIEGILKAASVEEAQQRLDISGYPNEFETVQIADIEPSIETEPDWDKPFTDEVDLVHTTDATDDDVEAVDIASGEIDEDTQTSEDHTEQTRPETPQQEHSSSRAGHDPATEHVNGDVRKHDENMPGQMPKPQTSEKRPKGQRSRGILRSYVTQGSDEAKEIDPTVAEHRANVDRAGVYIVLAFEEANNRSPQEQHHNNEGFDVMSVDEDGVVRYIEVKSLSGSWDNSSPASISSSQYEKAREAGAAFWLYVVEKAISTPRLYCIHNPAYQITNYLFDDGWMVMNGIEYEE